jgi:hypothetical protein
MNTEQIIVYIILAACLIYAGRRIYLTIKRSETPCDYGCPGCILKDSCKKSRKSFENSKE